MERNSNENTGLSISEMPFGELPDGRTANLYHLKNTNGMEVKITNFGGIIQSILVPDRNNQLSDVVLGFDSLSQYVDGHPFFGPIVGRFANRIANGTFRLGDTTYTLAQNNGTNHIHGGPNGFDKQLWEPQTIENDSAAGLVLSYLSKDGEEGYPGNLSVKVTYTINNDNELRVDYEASADRPTICNLTNHSYFNLAGAGNGDILNHRLILYADHYTPVDERLIPTGEVASVEDTPFDFRNPTAIGARIELDHPQLKNAGGYDHNWVINGSGLRKAATVYELNSSRLLEVWTTEPGVQFYAGNNLREVPNAKEGKVYNKRSGFCLETQHYPNSPNQPEFPSVVVEPGREYRSTTVFRFTVE